MRLWVDVYDAAGNRLGDGPITTLDKISAKRIKNGSGNFSFTTPLTDDRARTLLQPNRRIQAYKEVDGTQALYDRWHH